MVVVGRRDLATDMRKRIVTRRNGARYHEYFAYGSNMDADQMARRCPSAERVGVSFLPDHRLVFNRRGSYRPGGVASVVPEPGAAVYGVVWRISAADVERLDDVEDPQAYRRRVMTTIGVDGSSARAFVYEAIPEGEFFTPDEAYLQILLDAAVQSGLPERYVDELRSTFLTVPESS